MEEKKIKPFISVIVPVYNGEDVINRSLDSLFHQTYENLEVIVVDDGSTDRTAEILEKYKENWGDKIQVFHIENSGQGRARSVAIEHAKGELLAFCDADDYFVPDGIECMEREFGKQNVDVLYVPYFRESEGGRFRIGEILPPFTQAEVIRRISILGFCNLLVKKELCKKMGDIPSIIYEDIAYVGAMLTQAKSVGYYPHPVYHYVNTPGSVVNANLNPRILQLRDAIDWGLAHASEQFKNELMMAYAMKCVEKVRSVWYYSDFFLEKLHSMRTMIESNPIYIKYEKDYKVLKAFLELPEKPFENYIYVDGISQAVTLEYEKEIEKKAYREGAKVIILRPEMCEISLSDKAAMAAFCGMQKVLETGGVYIGSHMAVKGNFDCMRHHRAFFGYADLKTLSVKVFGGQKQSPILSGIYEVWKEKLKEEICDISTLECSLTSYLTEVYGLKLTGDNTYTQYPFVTLSPTVVMVDYEGNTFHLCECREHQNSENEQIVSMQLARALIETASVSHKRRINNLKAKITRLEYRVKEQQNELQYYKGDGRKQAFEAVMKLQKHLWGRVLLKLVNRVLK